MAKLKLVEDPVDGEESKSIVLTLGLTEAGGLLIEELEPQLDILCRWTNSFAGMSVL